MNKQSENELELDNEYKQIKSKLDLDSVQIIEARHPDPFSVLGRHERNGVSVIRVFMPHAETVNLGKNGPEMLRIPYTDFFEYEDTEDEFDDHYLLSWVDKDGKQIANDTLTTSLHLVAQMIKISKVRCLAIY